MHNKTLWALLIVTVWSLSGVNSPISFAEESHSWSFRPYTGFMPLASGEAVKSQSETIDLDFFEPIGLSGEIQRSTLSQSYSDVYTGGIPFLFETVYRFNPQWSFHGGIGFQYFPAKSFTLSTGRAELVTTPPQMNLNPVTIIADFNVEGKLDDMYRIPIFLGGAYHLPTMTNAKIAPYLRLDVGAIVQPAVAATFTTTRTTRETNFWDTSVLALVDGGLGVEVPLKSVGVFAEVRVQYTSAPSAADGLGGINDSDGLVAIPLIAGMSF